MALPQACLWELINSQLDHASRVALLQTSRTLSELVLSSVPTAKLEVDVSSVMRCFLYFHPLRPHKVLSVHIFTAVASCRSST
jgi:hypothetical protein